MNDLFYYSIINLLKVRVFGDKESVEHFKYLIALSPPCLHLFSSRSFYLDSDVTDVTDVTNMVESHKQDGRCWTPKIIDCLIFSI